MSFSQRDIIAAASIISIFETSKAHGRADAVAVLPDGAGISYGRAQATDRSDALDDIIKLYIEKNGALASELKPYLPKLALNTKMSIKQLAADEHLKGLLHQAGQEAVMVEAQNEVFTRRYMAPSIAICDARKYKEPLSLSVIYDSHVQGAWDLVRNRTNADITNERQWIWVYLQCRYKWLANHTKLILRKTVYRPTAYLELIKTANWGLATPFEVHGLTVNESDLL